MLTYFRIPSLAFCTIAFGNIALANDEQFKFHFSQSDGTGKPSDICITHAEELAEQMEGGSIAIEELRFRENRGPNDVHPRATLRVTYNLPGGQKVRIHLTCNYGLERTVAQTKSGAECIELNKLALPETTEPGVQDSFQIRLDKYENYGGDVGGALFASMVERYKMEFKPAPTSHKFGCEKLE